MGQKINAKELAGLVGATSQRIGWWVRKGMPCENSNGSRRFDTVAVEGWLLDRGLIEQESDGKPEVAASRQECAQYFGVHEHTISSWSRRPGFPGRSSDPGRKNGYYPLDEIDVWLLAEGIHPTKGPRRNGDVSSSADEDVKRERVALLQVQRAEKELRLAQKRGELVEVATVTAFISRQINQAGPLIDEIPDRALAKLPPDLSQEARDAIYNDFAGLAMDIRAVLGELTAGDLDDDEPGEADESGG